MSLVSGAASPPSADGEDEDAARLLSTTPAPGASSARAPLPPSASKLAEPGGRRGRPGNAARASPGRLDAGLHRLSQAPAALPAAAPPPSRCAALGGVPAALTLLLGVALLVAGAVEVSAALRASGTVGRSREQRSSPPPPQSSPAVAAPERMVIVAGSTDGNGKYIKDLTWLLYWLPDLCAVAYDHADAEDGAKPLAVAPNVGREAPAFVRFIVDHYDALPARMVFLHGDRSAWHDRDLVTVLRLLRWEREYANLNFGSKYVLDPGDAGLAFRYNFIKAAWPTVFEPFFGALPPRFNIHCCAQFMVSRDNVRAVPLAFWRAYLAWMTVRLGDLQAEVDRSILVEHMWLYLLNRPPAAAAWDADIDDNAEAELCRVLTACPLPAAPPAIDPALRQALRTSFYPCGAAYPAAGSRGLLGADANASTTAWRPAPGWAALVAP